MICRKCSTLTVLILMVSAARGYRSRSLKKQQMPSQASSPEMASSSYNGKHKAGVPAWKELAAILVAMKPTDAFQHANFGPHVRVRGVAPGRISSVAMEGEGEKKLTESEVEEVGNLVEDDEWLGFGMELAIVLRSAVRESVKKNVKDFTGKDDYAVGDLSKEMDARVKNAVAEYRSKEDYELGDLTLTLDQLAKEEVQKLTGKDTYEAGDLSTELDKRVKESVAGFCGKDEYAPGDLSREIDSRIKKRVGDFTGEGEYEFGDISREIEKRRVEWVQDYLGKSGYEFGDFSKKFISDFTGKENYEFGDLTKSAVKSFTGKDDYQFGDISKAIGQKLFGNKEVKKKD